MATLLSIDQDPLISAELRKYQLDTKEILCRAEGVHEDRAKLLTQSELQHKAWAAKVLICRSHFTPDQQRILDGRILEWELKIDDFCKLMAKELEKCKVPVDITDGTKSSLEERLVDFLHNKEEKVLLLQAPQGAHKTQASKFLAHRAWSELKWIPVIVNLQKLKVDDQCVANAMKSFLIELDNAAILHAQATRNFLLVIEGFDKSECKVNVYVRSR